jgi:predicted DNA-binding transcriptional regulator AlpA
MRNLPKIDMEKAIRLKTLERPMMSFRYFTAREVSEITGISVETLAQWRSQDRGIPYLKISRNCVRYRDLDLDEWLSGRIVPIDPDARKGRRPS